MSDARSQARKKSMVCRRSRIAKMREGKESGRKPGKPEGANAKAGDAFILLPGQL